jgi:hypothetical protein
MEVSGSTGLELFLAPDGQRSTAAERQYVDLRVFLRSILRSDQRGRDRLEYVNPFFGRPFFAGAPGTEGNLVFRALRYSAEEIARAKATI